YGSPFDMMRQFDISFRTAGENIAGNKTVEGAFKAWMNSAGHKKNILNSSFNYTGIGIVDSPKYGKILVQMFIGR
ncbi:MAG: SCP-like extracellular protein, partial [Clostridiaceae bacterium]|nr:SCP-like extracellular protein [Clostridiaceae bacterium]